MRSRINLRCSSLLSTLKPPACFARPTESGDTPIGKHPHAVIASTLPSSLQPYNDVSFNLICAHVLNSAPTQPAVTSIASPSLRVRLAYMVYEAMLLFGVLFIATWLFSTLLQQRHALYMRTPLIIWLFTVLGLYFMWFWTHGGQTLAMKTWRLQLTTVNGDVLNWRRALLRYVLMWLWFVPGLALASLFHAQGWMLVILPTLNFILWAAAIFLHTDRQYLHDRWAQTRLVQLEKIATPSITASTTAPTEPTA